MGVPLLPPLKFATRDRRPPKPDSPWLIIKALLKPITDHTEDGDGDGVLGKPAHHVCLICVLLKPKHWRCHVSRGGALLCWHGGAAKTGNANQHLTTHSEVGALRLRWLRLAKSKRPPPKRQLRLGDMFDGGAAQAGARTSFHELGKVDQARVRERGVNALVALGVTAKAIALCSAFKQWLGGARGVMPGLKLPSRGSWKACITGILMDQVAAVGFELAANFKLYNGCPFLHLQHDGACWCCKRAPFNESCVPGMRRHPHSPQFRRRPRTLTAAPNVAQDILRAVSARRVFSFSTDHRS